MNRNSLRRALLILTLATAYALAHMAG